MKSYRRTRQAWIKDCKCSGKILSRFIKKFIHAPGCPLRIKGLRTWDKAYVKNHRHTI